MESSTNFKRYHYEKVMMNYVFLLKNRFEEKYLLDRNVLLEN